jgi:hypothetical protein
MRISPAPRSLAAEPEEDEAHEGAARRGGESAFHSGRDERGELRRPVDADPSASIGERPLSATGRAIDAAAIEAVTTAFLDAYVKRDAIAAEWLGRDAPRWIGERGELQHR